MVLFAHQSVISWRGKSVSDFTVRTCLSFPSSQRSVARSSRTVSFQT